MEQNQLSMFNAPREKGHREWSAFSAVREDRVGMYRVLQPQKPMAIKSDHNVLRIIQPHNAHLRSAH